jgi:hypothetical protein
MTTENDERLYHGETIDDYVAEHPDGLVAAWYRLHQAAREAGLDNCSNPHCRLCNDPRDYRDPDVEVDWAGFDEEPPLTDEQRRFYRSVGVDGFEREAAPASWGSHLFVVDRDGVAQDYDEWRDTVLAPTIDARAWAKGGPSVEPKPYRDHHTWKTTAVAAVVAIAVGALIAAVLMITLGASERDDHNQWPDGYKNPTPVTPTREADPGPMPPIPFTEVPVIMAGPETPDGQYLQMLRAANLTWDNRAAVIQDGHDICLFMARPPRDTPESMAQREYRWHATTPGWDPLSIEQCRAAVNAAVTVYCPEMR